MEEYCLKISCETLDRESDNKIVLILRHIKTNAYTGDQHEIWTCDPSDEQLYAL
jgi:hypothetical protein